MGVYIYINVCEIVHVDGMYDVYDILHLDDVCLCVYLYVGVCVCVCACVRQCICLRCVGINIDMCVNTSGLVHQHLFGL